MGLKVYPCRGSELGRFGFWEVTGGALPPSLRIVLHAVRDGSLEVDRADI